MEEKKAWEQPKCKGCGKDINFVVAKNKAGILKSHPINPDAAFLLVSTGTKDERGRWIYEAKKGYMSHFANCPAADTFRNRDNKPADQSAGTKYKTDEEFTNSLDSDKPPF